jgi:hypothetical protein
MGQVFVRNLIRDHYPGMPVMSMESDIVDVETYSEAEIKNQIDTFIEMLDTYKNRIDSKGEHAKTKRNLERGLRCLGSHCKVSEFWTGQLGSKARSLPRFLLTWAPRLSKLSRQRETQAAD